MELASVVLMIGGLTVAFMVNKVAVMLGQIVGQLTGSETMVV